MQFNLTLFEEDQWVDSMVDIDNIFESLTVIINHILYVGNLFMPWKQAVGSCLYLDVGGE